MRAEQPASARHAVTRRCSCAPSLPQVLSLLFFSLSISFRNATGEVSLRLR
jgi:hypothetical protein